MTDRTTRMHPPICERPLTHAVQRALSMVRDTASASDLLYLERWEISPLPGAAAALRVGQLRRANPGLAAEISAEVAARRREHRSGQTGPRARELELAGFGAADRD